MTGERPAGALREPPSHFRRSVRRPASVQARVRAALDGAGMFQAIVRKFSKAIRVSELCDDQPIPFVEGDAKATSHIR